MYLYFDFDENCFLSFNDNEMINIILYYKIYSEFHIIKYYIIRLL